MGAQNISSSPPLAEGTVFGCFVPLLFPVEHLWGPCRCVQLLGLEACLYHLQNSSSKITQLSYYPGVLCPSAQPWEQRFSAWMSGKLTWKPRQVANAPRGGPEQHQSVAYLLRLWGRLPCRLFSYLHPRVISVPSQCLLVTACCKLVYVVFLFVFCTALKAIWAILNEVFFFFF